MVSLKQLWSLFILLACKYKVQERIKSKNMHASLIDSMSTVSEIWLKGYQIEDSRAFTWVRLENNIIDCYQNLFSLASM